MSVVLKVYVGKLQLDDVHSHVTGATWGHYSCLTYNFLHVFLSFHRIHCVKILVIHEPQIETEPGYI